MCTLRILLQIRLKGHKSLLIVTRETNLLGRIEDHRILLILSLHTSLTDAVDILNTRGLKIDEAALRTGLETARWRARFEIIAKDPTVIFDGAHNPQGIDVAVDSIKHYFDTRVVIFTGVLKDKDYRYIASRLSEVALEVFTITPDNPRALTAEEYAAVLTEQGVAATPCDSIGEALERGRAAARESGVPMCCLGSLYTYVDVINSLKGE